MKIIWLITIGLAALLSGTATAQTLNWSAIQEEQRHIASLQAGWDYAATIGLGYGYKLKTKLPVVVGTQFSLPAGNNLMDDFKARVGAQVCIVKAGHFLATVMVHGIYRQYQHADLVRFQNFGSEMNAIAGYYTTNWFIAGEFGFDKAIVTHIKSNESMGQYYPGFHDGWYVPTGGNFHYGIQTGYSFKGMDAYLKAGNVVDQQFKPSARIPYYLQLGINVKF